MTHTSPSVSMPPGQPPDADCFRPMPEPEARKYLTSAGFLTAENFQSEKLFSASMGLSTLLMAVYSDDYIEHFLDAVFNEDEDTIARCIAGAYRILEEPVPKHLTALAAFPGVWSEVICISSVLIEDEDDPTGIERTRRISELLRFGGKEPATQKGQL